MSGVLPVRDAYTQNATTQPDAARGLPASAAGVVVSLVDAGVSPEVASTLVRDFGERECSEQVAALPYRRAREGAAVLVASIRGRWAVPMALVREREKAQRAAERAAKIRAAAVVQAQREKARATAENAFLGLSGAERDSLRLRAVAAWQTEQPAAARMMLGRPAGELVVKAFMLRLLATERGLPGRDLVAV